MPVFKILEIKKKDFNSFIKTEYCVFLIACPELLNPRKYFPNNSKNLDYDFSLLYVPTHEEEHNQLLFLATSLDVNLN